MNSRRCCKTHSRVSLSQEIAGTLRGLSKKPRTWREDMVLEPSSGPESDYSTCLKIGGVVTYNE
jgi:hypothetical protein